MIQSPIVKVLSTIRKHGVKALLGGQACVFYGAAEFSKDADIVLLSEPENIERLRRALAELEATQAYVPALEERALDRGHGVHFKCSIPEAKGIRLYIMSKLRGVDPFEKLWARRTVFADLEGNEYDVLGLEDLVRAKKTQRRKDWPMIHRGQLYRESRSTNRAADRILAARNANAGISPGGGSELPATRTRVDPLPATAERSCGWRCGTART